MAKKAALVWRTYEPGMSVSLVARQEGVSAGLLFQWRKLECDSGPTVTSTFTEDCCDREVMAWRAWEGKGLPGEPVREMLIEAVERRFGTVEAVPAGQELELLSDNGGAYIATERGRWPARWV